MASGDGQAQFEAPALEAGEESRGGGRQLQTLQRGLAVLEWLVAHPARASVRQASEALGLDYTRCYRLVNTLVASGYLVRSGRGMVRPGPGFLRLWPVYLRDESPKELESVGTQLRDTTRESTYVAVWDGQDVVLVYVADGLNRVRVTAYEPGYRQAAHARSTGKAILAYLPLAELDAYLASHELVRYTDSTIVDVNALRVQLEQIRWVGLAFDYEELFPGICSVAAPIFGPLGDVVAGIALSVPAAPYGTHLDRFTSDLLSASQRASKALGYRGPYPRRPSE